jgi:hypothetical protein
MKVSAEIVCKIDSRMPMCKTYPIFADGVEQIDEGLLRPIRTFLERRNVHFFKWNKIMSTNHKNVNWCQSYDRELQRHE